MALNSSSKSFKPFELFPLRSVAVRLKTLMLENLRFCMTLTSALAEKSLHTHENDDPCIEKSQKLTEWRKSKIAKVVGADTHIVDFQH